MGEAVALTPTKYQQACLSVLPFCNVAAFGGRGSGKTKIIEFATVLEIQKYGRDANILICRRTLNSMQQLMLSITQTLRMAFGEARPNLSNNTIYVPSHEALVTFQPLAGEDHYARAQGSSWGALFIDEASTLPNLRYVNLLRTGLRTTVKDRRPLMIMTANPGGRCGGQIKKHYVDKAAPWEVFEDDGGTPWIWTASSFRDNEHLPESYRKELEAGTSHDPQLREMFLEGKWLDLGGGQMFDLQPDVHYIEAVPPGADCVWHVGYDFGSASPQAATLIGYTRNWSTIGGRSIPSGSYIVADECCSCMGDNLEISNGMSVGAFVSRLKDMMKRNGAEWAPVAVDNSRGLHGAHDTVVNIFRENQIAASPVRQKGRANQWSLIRELMHNTCTGEGRPLFFVPSRCRHITMALPEYERHANYPEDIADGTAAQGGTPGHHLDSFAYGLINSYSGFATSRRTIGMY